jgi:hypothetical protein
LVAVVLVQLPPPHLEQIHQSLEQPQLLVAVMALDGRVVHIIPLLLAGQVVAAHTVLIALDQVPPGKEIQEEPGQVVPHTPLEAAVVQAQQALVTVAIFRAQEDQEPNLVFLGPV